MRLSWGCDKQSPSCSTPCQSLLRINKLVTVYSKKSIVIKKQKGKRNKFVHNCKENDKSNVEQKPRRKWIKQSKYNKMKNKLKKTTISVVNKYSSIALTPTFENLLNRGSIIPLKGGCQKHAEGRGHVFLGGCRPVSPFLGRYRPVSTFLGSV